MQKLLPVLLLAFSITTQASDIIPMGHGNNRLYYKIGGSNDFALPPVSSTRTTILDTRSNLGIGYSCGAYNPALSITNSINDLKNSADNLEQNIIASATGSLIQLPMYLLAQANPTAYNLLNSTLLDAHKRLELSTKSCEAVKSQIAKGQNPYQDWGTLSVNDQWKKHLTMVSSGNEDINNSKKDIDAHSGDTGVPWVQGKIDSDTSLHAGGKSQPPIHVISDTVKSGYNTMLNRDLQSDFDAPNESQNSELRQFFPNPKSASDWITNVIGDQVITTCNDESCKKQQGSLVGHGLLPWVTSCQANKNDCTDTIRDDLGNLVTGNQTITKDSLRKVSADGIAVSPDVIASIRGMDITQQKIIIDKLAQEVAVQRVMDKAFIAKNILATGAQVPVIAANHPAQVIIGRAIMNLDNDIRSLAFESQVRKQTISNTISETLQFENQQQQDAMRVSPVSSSTPLMENGAIPKELPK
ncbi:MAG: integrating conjugative element protein [Gammaproteobacteria bacterium]